MRDDFWPPMHKWIAALAFLIATLFAVTAGAEPRTSHLAPVCVTAMGVTTCLDDAGRVVSIAQMRPHATEKRVVMSVAAVAAFVDATTTMWGIGSGDAFEANPGVSWAITSSGVLYGITKGVGTVVVELILDWLYDHGHPKIARVLGGAAIGSWTWAGVKNGQINRRNAAERNTR